MSPNAGRAAVPAVSDPTFEAAKSGPKTPTEKCSCCFELNGTKLKLLRKWFGPYPEHLLTSL